MLNPCASGLASYIYPLASVYCSESQVSGNIFWPCSKIFFPGGSAGKKSACSVGDLGLIPGLRRTPGEGKGYPLQYSKFMGEFHELYNPWGCKESDMTDRLSLQNLQFSPPKEPCSYIVVNSSMIFPYDVDILLLWSFWIPKNRSLTVGSQGSHCFYNFREEQSLLGQSSRKKVLCKQCALL